MRGTEAEKHPAVPGKGPQHHSWGKILLWRGAANPEYHSWTIVSHLGQNCSSGEELQTLSRERLVHGQAGFGMENTHSPGGTKFHAASPVAAAPQARRGLGSRVSPGVVLSENRHLLPRAPPELQEQERVPRWQGHCLRRCRHILQQCRCDPAGWGGHRGRKPPSAPRGCRLSRFPAAQPPPSG